MWSLHAVEVLLFASHLASGKRVGHYLLGKFLLELIFEALTA